MRVSRSFYRFPSRLNDADTTVEETFWFTRLSDNEPVDLRADSEYSGRVQYHCGENDCTLRITDLRESDSAEYKCCNLRGFTKIYVNTSLPDGPQTSTLSVSPSGEIVEGSSVTLTCSSDANPAANYTWYKENLKLLQGPEGVYHFSSISSEDRGNYYCKSENKHGQINSTSLFLDVQYAPKLLSVSVSPSGEIVEGSSVTLTCSSDANPAANYTWYKENEDSPKASGQIFTITDLRPEHNSDRRFLFTSKTFSFTCFHRCF
uniref:Ig-like domain-containing protein n=1 Tax=Seriola lalandi dorsalis TaxID=1841481 RepID=A0A3B4WQF2_SERLL